jgi:collagenase-like PrtC family protease
MEIRVSTNWDPQLPEALKEFPVSHVYGKLADDVIGGCRPSFLLPQITRKEIADHVISCHKAGIKFSYLINTLCLNNTQYTREGYGQIRELLDWLSEIKVDALTIAIPYLIRLVKKHYPHFYTKVSSVSRINTVTRARQYEDMGVDEIIIDEMLNRDFATLQAINDATHIPLEVIGNPCCLWECAQQFEHVNHDGHASQSQSHNNYCYLQIPYIICSSQKLNDPVNIMKARWKRPEDLHYYEEIGISRFKVVERFKTSSALTMAVKAYAERNFDGNLIDLLTLPNKGSFLPPNFAYFNKPQMVDMEQVQTVAGLMDFSFNDAVNIPNKSLDGFLKFFQTHDCRRLSCDDCGYCRKIFEKVATCNKDVAQAQVKKLTDFAEVIMDGRIFGES